MNAKVVGLLWMIVFSGTGRAGSSIPLWETEYSLIGARESGFSRPALDGAGNSYFTGYTLVKVDSEGRQVWATRLPSRFGGLVALDGNGTVYVGGEFATNVTSDFGLLKYNPNGELVWQRIYEPPDNTADWVNGVECDRAGNVYVAGGSLASGIGAYSTVLKYDGNGNLLWARRSERSPHTNDRGTMAVNPLGGIAVATRGTIVSYSAEGELLWSWLGENESVEAPPRLIAFDHAGNLFTTDQNFRVSKFSPAGRVLWTAGYDNPVPGDALTLGYMYANDLKVDALGNAFIAADGPTRCEIRMEDGKEEAHCRTLPLVVKFSPEGKLAWASRFSTATNEGTRTMSLAVDNQGGLHLLAIVEFADADENLMKPIALLGTCDVEGNQVSRTIYAYDSPRRLFPFHVQLDARQDLVMAAELIARVDGRPDADYLLVKFRIVTEERLRILKAPKAQTAAEESTVTLRVVANRQGRARYQWRFNGEPIAGAMGPTLTLRNVQNSDAGEYSVEVNEGARQIVTPEARLQVRP